MVEIGIRPLAPMQFEDTSHGTRTFWGHNLSWVKCYIGGQLHLITLLHKPATCRYYGIYNINEIHSTEPAILHLIF